MKTSDLIAALARDTSPVRPLAAARRLAWPLAGGAAAALVLLITVLGLRHLDEAVRTEPFWMKAAYTGVLALAGLVLTARLSRPAGTAGLAPWIIAVTVAILCLLGLSELAGTAPDGRLALWLGGSWTRCSLRIVMLAAPVYLAVALAMRRLAPTRLAAAGAAAGLLAGAAGATVYGLYCPETSAAFVVTWYTLGIAVCGVLGGLIGTRLLRW